MEESERLHYLMETNTRDACIGVCRPSKWSNRGYDIKFSPDATLFIKPVAAPV